MAKPAANNCGGKCTVKESGMLCGFVDQPGKVQSCAYSTDGAREHIVEHQSRYGNLGRGAAHGVAHDPVHPASHKHTAALDVHCTHGIRKQHDPENEPGR